MNKEQSLRILMLLAQLEGYIAGKLSTHVLPDYMAEELSDVCELLSKNIRES